MSSLEMQSSWMINGNGIKFVVLFWSGSRTHMFITHTEIMLNFKAMRNSQEPGIFRIKTLTMSTVHSPCAFIIAMLLRLKISAFMLQVKD